MATSDNGSIYVPSTLIPCQIGRIIDDGRLQMTEILGQGGWGVVYLAITQDPQPGQPQEQFAVKCIRHQDMMPHHLLALSREVSLHEFCSIRSNRVLKYHKVLDEEDDELFFIISEYCPDGDLLDMIMNDRYVGEHDLIRDVFVQILDAVQDIHRAKVFHRDLKPENILCKEGGTKIVLADFGFATQEGKCTDFKIGSEPFMSPDVRGGLHYPFNRHAYCARRADVWALGIILLNLVVGSSPWAKASTNDPDFLTYLVRDRQFLLHSFPITEELHDLLLKVLTPEAENRISIAVLRDEVMKVQKFTTMEVGMSLRDVMGSDLWEDRSLLTDSAISLVGPYRSVQRPVSEGPEPVFTPPMRFHAFPPPPIHPDRRRFSSIPTLVNSDMGSEPEIIDAPAQALIDLPATLSSSFIIVSNDELDDSSASESDGEDSDAESDGPITPEQRAADADPTVISNTYVVLEDVPDLSADVDANMGMSMTSPRSGWFAGVKADADVGMVMVDAPGAGAGVDNGQGSSSAKQALRDTARRMGNTFRKLQIE